MKTNAEHLAYIAAWTKANRCKSREYKRRWRERNPEKMKLARENWKLNNRDRILESRRARTERLTGKKVFSRVPVSNEEKRRKANLRSNQWHHAHKREVARSVSGKVNKKVLTPQQWRLRLERQKVWRAKNPERMRAYDLKTRGNPVVIVKRRLSARINSALRRRNIIKGARIVQLVGCTWPFLKQYIETRFKDGMSWDNRSLWHIDHRKPCASFDLTDPEQQRICFHFSNLQPLWGADNMSKGAKWQEAA